MTPAQSARICITIYSLSITGFLILFLILSQAMGIHFDYAKHENFRLIDIILPTFFGYLGAASHFLFNANKGREIEPENAILLRLLIHGPFVIFISAVISLFYVYQYTHRPLAADEPRIYYLEFESLSRYLSVCLGMLAVTVGVVSSYLFGSASSRSRKK